MSITIRSKDDAGISGIGLHSANHFTYTYFAGVDTLPQAGDTLVVVLCTDNGSNNITSITDTNGNTYQQLPGAFISTNPSSGLGPNGTGFIMDIWYAENITVNGGVVMTVNWSGTASEIGVSVLDVVGITGGNKSAMTSSAAVATNPQTG